MSATIHQRGECSTDFLKVFDSSFNLGEASFRNFTNRSAMCPVVESNQLSDLGQAKPKLLSSFYEANAINEICGVIAIRATWRGRWDQTDRLVIADGFNAHLRCAREAANGEFAGR